MINHFLKVVIRYLLSIVLSLSTTFNVHAAETTTSATGSMFKMLIGLAVVLLVLAIITWAMKKFMPNVTNQPSVIRVIGGASVGARERVVVLEVANRWIVVGVAAGQVTSLANLEPADVESTSILNTQSSENTLGKMQGKFNSPEKFNSLEKFNLSTAATHGFAKWLKDSTAKIIEKKTNKDA